MNISVTPVLIADLIAIHGEDAAKQTCKDMISLSIDEYFKDSKALIEEELNKRQNSLYLLNIPE